MDVNVWGVFCGEPGYLPDSSAFFTTKGGALEYARVLKEEFIEFGYQDEDPPSIRVRGDVRRDLRYEVLRRDYRDEWTVWQYISVEPTELEPEDWLAYQRGDWA